MLNPKPGTDLDIAKMLETTSDHCAIQVPTSPLPLLLSLFLSLSLSLYLSIYMYIYIFIYIYVCIHIFIHI